MYEPLLKPKANPFSLPLSVLISFIFLCEEVLIRRNYLIDLPVFVSTLLNVSLMRTRDSVYLVCHHILSAPNRAWSVVC